MLDSFPFCKAPAPVGGVQCQLHFKLNGNVEKARSASPRGACIREEALTLAATMNTNDALAAVLMGLAWPNYNFSIDGPIANALFVKNLRLNGMSGNDCGPRDDACAFYRAGGFLIDRDGVIDANEDIINSWVPKHEIGHLFKLNHTGTPNMYVSDTVTDETKINVDRCEKMRRRIPQAISPWFIGLGGSLSQGVNCP